MTRGASVAEVAGACFCLSSFICPVIPQKTQLFLRLHPHPCTFAVVLVAVFASDCRRLAASSFSSWPRGQQPPSIRVGRLGPHPMPYASMTLSGSRKGKRTHLFFGESNSCRGRPVVSPVPFVIFPDFRTSPFPRSGVGCHAYVVIAYPSDSTCKESALPLPRLCLRGTSPLQVLPQRHQHLPGPGHDADPPQTFAPCAEGADIPTLRALPGSRVATNPQAISMASTACGGCPPG